MSTKLLPPFQAFLLIKKIRQAPKSQRKRLVNLLLLSKVLDQVDPPMVDHFRGFWSIALDDQADWLSNLQDYNQNRIDVIEEVTLAWSKWVSSKNLAKYAASKSDFKLIFLLLELTAWVSRSQAVEDLPPPKGWIACQQKGNLVWMKFSPKGHVMSIEHQGQGYYRWFFSYPVDSSTMHLSGQGVDFSRSPAQVVLTIKKGIESLAVGLADLRVKS